MTRNLDYMTPYGVVEELRKTDPELAEVLSKGLAKMEADETRYYREAVALREMMGLRIPLHFDGKREFGIKPIKFGSKGNRIPLQINKDHYPTFKDADDPNLKRLQQMLWSEEHIAQALEGTVYLYEYVSRYYNHNNTLTHTLHAIRNNLEILVDPERWGELYDAINEYRERCREKLEKK